MAELNRGVVHAVLSAGLAAGTTDLGVACLIYRLSPRVILDSIASGLIGGAAFKGGMAVALLGLSLQWAMSILIAVIYLGVTAPLPQMRGRWRLSGVLAGVAIYLVMSYIVVPLSAAPFRPRNLHDMLAALTPYNFTVSLLAMILFGLIIAFFLRNCVPAAAQRSDIP